MYVIDMVTLIPVDKINGSLIIPRTNRTISQVKLRIKPIIVVPIPKRDIPAKIPK